MPLKGLKEFEVKLNAVGKVSASKKLWGQIGFQAIDIISQRTLKGNDYQGAAFTRYDKDYKLWKQKRGGKFFSGSPNLHNSGNMFSSLKPKPTDKNVTLFFSKPLEAKKAAIHNKGLGGMPKREFFNLSTTEQNQLLDILRKKLKKAING
jgi:phage gpG-like protein